MRAALQRQDWSTSGRAEQFTPEFTKINPLQKVPAIVDHDGPGGKPYTVIESGAILMYLAEKTGKFIPHDPVARYDTLQWVVLQVANLGPMSGQVVHFFQIRRQPVSEYAISRYRTMLNKLYDLYEDRLNGRAFVAGDEYSIADIAAFPWLRNVELLGIDISSHPKITCLDRQDRRPATRAAVPTARSAPSSRYATTPPRTTRTAISAGVNTPERSLLTRHGRLVPPSRPFLCGKDVDARHIGGSDRRPSDGRA